MCAIRVTPEDRFFSVLPMHHTYECTACFLLSSYVGSSVAFCEGLRYIAPNMKEAKPTMILAVPALFENMYKKCITDEKEEEGKKHNPKSTEKGLLYKKADSTKHGEWNVYPLYNETEKTGLPFELHYYDYYGVQGHKGEQIIKVLADTDNIYIVTAEYENNDSEGTSTPSWIHLWTAQMQDCMLCHILQPPP